MKKRIKKKLLNTIATMCILLLIIFVLYNLYRMYQNIDITQEYTTQRTSLSTQSSQAVENVKQDSKSIVDIIEKVTQSVCGISKLSNAGGSILSTATESELGLGTGIIVSENGYIVSNAHVTGEKYSTCYIKIEGKDTYTGTVVWADTDLDLSITKINADGLDVAELGTSKESRVGETVYAIGNPIGYEFRRTVTSGIISAINSTVKLEENGTEVYMTDLIQTDATINPGNSGGPLIDLNGRVIGINSVKITSAEGIGFAVPVDVIKPIIERFKTNGTFEEANLGLYVYDKSVAQYLNLKTNYSSGIYVAEIIKNAPVYGKGLKEGDSITKIDNKLLTTVNDLREYIYTKSPGDTVTLTVNTGRYEKEIQVKLE